VPDNELYVTLDYARAFEAGALAALEYIDDNWPNLGDWSSDYPVVTTATAEHIGRVVDLMLGQTSA